MKPRGRLTREQGAQIVSRRRQGEGRITLAEDFKVSVETITRVTQGKFTNWATRPPRPARIPANPVGGPGPGNGLTEMQVRTMRRLRGDGFLLWELALQFGVSESTVSLIVRGLRRGPLEAR